MRSRYQFDTGVDTGRKDTAVMRAEPGWPGRLRLLTLAAGGLAAVLIAAFAALVALPLPAPAQAQTPAEVWSATLTVRVTFSGDPAPLGCDNTSTENRRCSDSTTLDDDDFTDDGTNYEVKKINRRTDGRLEFELNTRATAATQGLTLIIDGVSYFLGDATSENINNNKSNWKWSNPNLSWAEGGTVSVKLVAHNVAATGQPTISGGAQLDKTLAAETDEIEEPNALPTNPMFTYQWVRVDGSSNETTISGGDVQHLHADHKRRGPYGQGESELHRLPRQRRGPAH